MIKKKKLFPASRKRAANGRDLPLARKMGRVLLGRHLLISGLVAGLLPICAEAQAQVLAAEPTAHVGVELCGRGAEGSVVPEPKELRSQHGVLELELTFRNVLAATGEMRFCYTMADGAEAPTLRLAPGDILILHIKNATVPGHVSASAANPPAPAMSHAMEHAAATQQSATRNACHGGPMSAFATNLHFHGLMLPPVCHQDDVLKTLIQPGDAAFEYRFQIPADTPPGLYWYHPHPHGFTSAQVRGGASGALIVEGIETRNPLLSGLPERVLVIRDQDLLHPDAEPVKTDSMPVPQVLRDAEGDVMNMGFDGGRPAKDLTVNFVPVAFPEYKPAVIAVRAGERQFWRVLNASAITYLDLQLVVRGVPQMLGVAALDGVPLGERGGDASQTILWQSHLAIPPAGRVEFIVKSLPEGVKAEFVTRRVDTGPAGENDPTRPLATLLVAADAAEPYTHLPLSQDAGARAAVKSANNENGAARSAELSWLGDAQPVRTRKLYFSEVAERPDNPSSPTKFYITVDGEKPELFDPNAIAPNIIVHQGDVEDWIIENRTRELHAFHIHQIHFLLVEWNGVPLEEPYLRDTVNVAYWDGQSKDYPSVKLRMDFRDKRLAGTFPYHCHLLEHEDGGMMGTVQVVGPARR